MEASIATVAVDFVAAEKALKMAIICDESIGTVEFIRFKMMRGEFDSAREIAQKWVNTDRSDIRRWAQLAEVYFFENKPESALEAVDEALKQNPSRASLVRQKIGILLNLQRYQDAELCAKNLWTLKNEYLALAMWLRTIERAGDYEKALTIIKDLVDKRPQDKMLKAQLARQLSLAGDLEKSTEVLAKLCAEEPDSDVHIRNLVQSLMRLRMKDDALYAIKQFSLRQSSRMDIQVTTAGLALDQGLIDEARSLLTKVIQKTPDMIEAWIGAAMVERRANMINVEKELWRDIALNFHPSRWINNAIDHWLRLGLENEIEAVLNSWRSEEPNNPSPWWSAHKVSLKLKRYKEIRASNIRTLHNSSSLF
jgi:tetratricopeptide (TPR) repeat protein